MYDDFTATIGRWILGIVGVVTALVVLLLIAKSFNQAVPVQPKHGDFATTSDMEEATYNGVSRALEDHGVGSTNPGSSSSSGGSTSSSVRSKTYNGTRDNIEVQVASDSVFVIGGKEFTVGGKTYKNTVKTFEGGNTYTGVSITHGFIVLGPQSAVNDKVEELKDQYVN